MTARQHAITDRGSLRGECVMSAERPKCIWCGKRRKPSIWEQETLGGVWARLCGPCATKRLNNPWNALLPMRKVSP